MKPLYPLAIAAVAVCAAGVAFASPLKVRTFGTKSQQVIMCPDCSAKLACAKVGDYSIGFSADLESPKSGAAAVAVHVLDKGKKGVDDAAVVVTLTMPNHKHGKAPFTLKSAGHGRYAAATKLVMPGAYQADVAVTLAGGDTVKQSFSFTK